MTDDTRFEPYKHHAAVATLLGLANYWTKKLNLVFEQPPLSVSDGFMVRYEKGPRTLIVIEGRSDLVYEYQAAVAEVYEKHKDE